MIVSTLLSHIITAAKLYDKNNTLTVTTCTRPIRFDPRPSMKIETGTKKGNCKRNLL